MTFALDVANLQSRLKAYQTRPGEDVGSVGGNDLRI